MMSQNITNVELSNRFQAAYDLVNHSQGSKDANELIKGVELMLDTAQMCMSLGKALMMADGIRHVRGCINYKLHIKSYLSKQTSEAYFDQLLAHFPPYSNDIHSEDKSTMDVDEKLLKSLIRLDYVDDFTSYLRRFGMNSSRKAFAIALEEAFKLVTSEESNTKKSKTTYPILTMIDSYKPAATAKVCLPNEILDVMKRYPLEILSLHQQYRHDKAGGYLKVDILEALLSRAAANEVLTDVVLEIAGNSAFKLDEPNHLVWIEEVAGKVIGPETLKREFRGTNKMNDDIVAMLYYALCSPHFPADEVDSVMRQTTFMISSDIYVETMRLAVKAQKAPNEMFENKTASFIKTLFKRDRDTAQQLMNIPGIPRRRLMDEPVLRDLIMAGDLGL